MHDLLHAHMMPSLCYCDVRVDSEREREIEREREKEMKRERDTWSFIEFIHLRTHFQRFC